MGYSKEQPRTQKVCSKTAAQIFTVAAQNNLCEDFYNFSMVMKTSLMDG